MNPLLVAIKEFNEEKSTLKDVQKVCDHILVNDDIDWLTDEMMNLYMSVVYYFDMVDDLFEGDIAELESDIRKNVSSHIAHLLQTEEVEIEDKEVIVSLIYFVEELDQLLLKVEKNIIDLKNIHAVIDNLHIDENIKIMLNSLSVSDLKLLCESLKKDKFVKVKEILCLNNTGKLHS